MEPFEREGLADWIGPLLDGAFVTLQIALAAYALGLMLGLAGAAAKLGGSATLRGIAAAYTSLVRAIPELLLIILLYYAGTQGLNAALQAAGYGGRVEISGFVAAVTVLAFVQGAYMTEVLRGAIVAIPKSLTEAADSFGMSRGLRFRRIIVPLMLPNALAGMSNLWLILLKETALVSVVGFEELFFTAQQAAASTRLYATFYLAAGALFLAMTLASNVIFHFAERRLRRGQARG